MNLIDLSTKLINDIDLIFSSFHLQYKHSETSRRYADLPSTDSLVDWSLWANNDVKSNPKVDLYVVFGRDVKDDTARSFTVGKAWVGGACIQCNVHGASKPVWCGTSFNEWSKTPSATAAVRKMTFICISNDNTLVC